MARNDEPKAEGEAVVVEVADGPLLDLTDAAVKRMIKIAKKRRDVVAITAAKISRRVEIDAGMRAASSCMGRGR